MAVTAIWCVKGTIKKTMDYITDKEKTIARQEVDDVLEYVKNDSKTMLGRYIKGINCLPSTAYDEMIAVKKRFNKENGITCFHAYQSFARGEGNPELIHKIGIELASELWGEKYQVVVATHLDKQHLHNHFLINSVSFIDGKKYNDCKKSYQHFRETSDNLCKKYNLSIVQENIKSKHYSEWLAEKEGKPTWRNLIKSDIDKAISNSITESQFFRNLELMGYEIKLGKYLSVRPYGKKRFFRPERNFGSDYSIESIRKKILLYGTIRNPNDMLIENPTYSVEKSNLTGLYENYVGILNESEGCDNSQFNKYMFLKEDLLKLHNISEEAKLLATQNIKSNSELDVYIKQEEKNFIMLCSERKKLRNQLRKIKDGSTYEIKIRIEKLTSQIRKSRRKLYLCDSIKQRSNKIQEKFDTLDTIESKKKEMRNEYRRTSNSPDHKN